MAEDRDDRFVAAADQLATEILASKQPFFFPDIDAPNFQEPLARLAYGLHDVFALLPNKPVGAQPAGEMLRNIAVEFASDYPEVSLEEAKRVVTTAYGIVHANLISQGPLNVESVSQNPDNPRELHLTAQTTLRVGSSREIGRWLFYSLRYWLGDRVLDTDRALDDGMLLGLWARLSTVPRAGEAHLRAALLVLAAHLEDYLSSTVEVAIVRGLAPEPHGEVAEQLAGMRRRGGFSVYRRFLRNALGTDHLEPMNEPIARRNVFVHHAGLASKQYVQAVGLTQVSEGDRLDLDPEYLQKASDDALSAAHRATHQLLAQQRKLRH